MRLSGPLSGNGQNQSRLATVRKHPNEQKGRYQQPGPQKLKSAHGLPEQQMAMQPMQMQMPVQQNYMAMQQPVQMTMMP